MTLSVRDVVNDLGVTNITVLRWIKNGELKGTLANRRNGYRIDEADYLDFLGRHTRWRIVHEGVCYSNRQLDARRDALSNVIAKIDSTKAIVALENRAKAYVDGFERAITDIQAAINREMIRKTIGDAENYN